MSLEEDEGNKSPLIKDDSDDPDYIEGEEEMEYKEEYYDDEALDFDPPEVSFQEGKHFFIKKIN